MPSHSNETCNRLNRHVTNGVRNIRIISNELALLPDKIRIAENFVRQYESQLNGITAIIVKFPRAVARSLPVATVVIEGLTLIQARNREKDLKGKLDRERNKLARMRRRESDLKYELTQEKRLLNTSKDQLRIHGCNR